MTSIQAPAVDRYLTRVPEKIPSRRREEPVVWGTQDGPLSSENLAFYEQNGFLQVDSLLTADQVRRCHEELDRLKHAQDLLDSELVIREPHSQDIRSIFRAHQVSEVFSDIIHSPRLADMARQILGSDVYIHQSRVNYKPAFGGAEFDWHSDFETWHAEDGMPLPRAFSISLSLTENYEFNGPLMVIPGSHKTFVPSIGETPAENHRTSLKTARLTIGTVDHEVLTDIAREKGIRQVTGPAGSGVLFDCNILHGSNGNITPFPRSNIFIVYNSIENKLGAPYYAPKERPHHLADREFRIVPRHVASQ